MHAVASSSPNVWAQPGTLGFLVVFGMGVVLFFVFRSMSRHLRKVRDAAAAEAEQAEVAEQAEQASTRGPDAAGMPARDYDHRLR